MPVCRAPEMTKAGKERAEAAILSDICLIIHIVSDSKSETHYCQDFMRRPSASRRCRSTGRLGLAVDISRTEQEDWQKCNGHACPAQTRWISEPYFSGSERSARRWSRTYRQRLVREDLAAIEKTADSFLRSESSRTDLTGLTSGRCGWISYSVSIDTSIPVHYIVVYVL